MAALILLYYSYRNEWTMRYIGMIYLWNKIQQSPSVGTNFAMKMETMFLKVDEQNLIREENFTDA